MQPNSTPRNSMLFPVAVASDKGRMPSSSKDCEAPVSLKIFTGCKLVLSPGIEMNPSEIKGLNSSRTSGVAAVDFWTWAHPREVFGEHSLVS